MKISMFNITTPNVPDKAIGQAFCKISQAIVFLKLLKTNNNALRARTIATKVAKMLEIIYIKKKSFALGLDKSTIKPKIAKEQFKVVAIKVSRSILPRPRRYATIKSLTLSTTMSIIAKTTK